MIWYDMIWYDMIWWICRILLHGHGRCLVLQQLGLWIDVAWSLSRGNGSSRLRRREWSLASWVWTALARRRPSNWCQAMVTRGIGRRELESWNWSQKTIWRQQRYSIISIHITWIYMNHRIIVNICKHDNSTIRYPGIQVSNMRWLRLSGILTPSAGEVRILGDLANNLESTWRELIWGHKNQDQKLLIYHIHTI